MDILCIWIFVQYGPDTTTLCLYFAYIYINIYSSTLIKLEKYRNNQSLLQICSHAAELITLTVVQYLID